MIAVTKTRTALATLLAAAIAAPSAGAHPADSPLPARSTPDAGAVVVARRDGGHRTFG